MVPETRETTYPRILPIGEQTECSGTSATRSNSLDPLIHLTPPMFEYLTSPGQSNQVSKARLTTSLTSYCIIFPSEKTNTSHDHLPTMPPSLAVTKNAFE